MTKSKQSVRERETSDLSETELNEATGGIIAVLRQGASAVGMCDGSVAPAPNLTPQTQGILIGLLKQ